MTLKSKLCSKKGYIFTYEAVAVVILFVAVFYMGYFTFTHINLTNQEQKRDLERFEKANLISDMIFKDYLFPSEYYKNDYHDFLEDVAVRHYGFKKIPGSYDPILVYTKNETLKYYIEIERYNSYLEIFIQKKRIYIRQHFWTTLKQIKLHKTYLTEKYYILQ